MRILKKVVPSLLALAMLTGCGAAGANSGSKSQKFDKEVDVLVVGAGIAGLSAAVELADQGCESVLVVEKLPYLGGSAFISDGIIAAHDSKLAKDNGIDVTLEECYNYQMENKQYTIDPELTMITTEKAGESIDWLMDVVKVPFEPEVQVKVGYSDLQINHVVAEGGKGMRAPFDEALKARTNIELMTESPATELITDENKNVIGAVIKTKDDKEIRIGAKATILTTGGYASNEELFTRLYPKNSVVQPGILPGATGDGLIMASELGAGILNPEAIQCYLREYEEKSGYTNNVYNIFVGQEGTRFMDERRVRQTFNKEIYEDTVNQMFKDGVDYYWGIADHATLEQFKMAEDAQGRAGVFKADTIEELAKAIGINAEGLVKTVAEWNEMVAKGEDTQFGRTQMMMPIEKGPFYAIKSSLAPTLGHGGLMRNEKSEVIKITGDSIPGLYAAGEVTAAANANGYTISHGITWGRIAAQNAVEYIKAK